MQAFFTILIIILTAVNGRSDASGTVMGCISSRSLKPFSAVLLASVCNLTGAVTAAFWHPKVAQTVYGMARLGDDPKFALITLCSALIAVTVWLFASSLLGLPTSGSHALLSGVCGAAFARNMSISVFPAEEWRSVIIGMFVSTLPVLALSFVIFRISSGIFAEQDRRQTVKYFKRVQCFSAGGSAFMHGAQESQKYLGVYMLGMSFCNGTAAVGGEEFKIPPYAILVCAAAMTVGTLLGGKRTVKKLGCDMTKTDAVGCSAADTACSAFLGVCSFFGIPTSGIQAKSCALMGVGLCKKDGTDLRVALQLFLGWVLTFPICSLLGFFLSLTAHAILI